jgi:UDP-N-acetylmuramoyl-tripeptide--D-alanyl-D-alanine ligase
VTSDAQQFWTRRGLAEATRGRWAHDPTRPLDGVSIDTRTLLPSQVFVALRGQRHDGHEYLARAMEAGASALVIDRELVWQLARSHELAGTTGVLVVEDTRRALMDMARAYRALLTGTRVVGVGGSNGKTSTVRMLDAVLSRRLRGRASPRSFNNDIGVPLTILSAQPTDQYLVCEMGTNAPGELGALSMLVEPDVSVCTSLGREHLEGLASLEGVAKEEAALVRGLRAGGVAIVNADHDLLLREVREAFKAFDDAVAMPGSSPRTMITFGTRHGATVRVARVSQDMEGLRFDLADGLSARLRALGAHNAVNAAAAIATARWFGLSTEQIVLGIERFETPPMRLERVEVQRVRIINDAYNANPESVLAALETFASVARSTQHTRLVLVLADMLELGEHAIAMHREVGDAVARMAKGLDLVVLVGPLMGFAHEQLAHAIHADKVVRIADVVPPRAMDVARMLRPGDLVLLKGSRAMALERIVHALKELSGEGVRGAPGPGVGVASQSLEAKPDASRQPHA